VPPPEDERDESDGVIEAAPTPPPPAHRPPLATLRSADEDEEREDTVTIALRPLREAERGVVSVASAPSIPPGPPSRLPVDLATLDPGPAEPEPEHRASAPPPAGLEASLAHIGVAVIELDAQGAVIDLNAAAERLTGWRAVDAIGAPSEEIFHLVPPDSQGPEAALAEELGGAPPDHTGILSRRDGQLIPIRHVVGASEHGGLIVFRDISGQQLLALQLARQARYDALTGLYNRRSLAERIDHAIADGKKRGARHALCYLDLDRFRLVNSTCGHDAGDDLLQWVGTRINELLGPHDSAGRIGGDEFALLLVDRDVREAERVAREIQRRLLEFRFAWQDKSFAVGASFGVVPFGAEMGRAAEVLGAADHACRLAKEAGRGRIQIYLEDDDQIAQSRRSIHWVAGLQKNLEDGKLRLFAQGIHPLVPRPDAGAHFEVLVRLVDEIGQYRSPVGIIHAAEHSGMMDAIDRFVVQRAFRMIGGLPQRAMRRLDTCAINLSGVSLLREGLLDFIVREMHKANVPPSKICFEVTETAALANLGEVRWLMQELGAMGCRFAIDDFGSGHASYGYIENLPVDYVKIDGLFVRDLGDNALHRAIVESVHRIGCTLGIKTVAEQVETTAIADLLGDIGVDYAQGWLYGKPAPLADVLAGLDRD
jgi:diguanylate cyclase (GGDEF)-like protein/PAS domain S-box-containing protein